MEKDVNGIEIKEGDILTFDWFYCDDPISDMRRKFSRMRGWTDKQILDRINKPTFKVKKHKKGFLFGEGIDKKDNIGRLYLHNFRFKFTKIIR